MAKRKAKTWTGEMWAVSYTDVRDLFVPSVGPYRLYPGWYAKANIRREFGPGQPILRVRATITEVKEKKR